MDNIVFECPTCLRRLRASPDLLGTNVSCPSCNGAAQVTRRVRSRHVADKMEQRSNVEGSGQLPCPSS